MIQCDAYVFVHPRGRCRNGADFEVIDDRSGQHYVCKDHATDVGMKRSFRFATIGKGWITRRPTIIQRISDATTDQP